jgi:hypothetical protein
VFRVQHDSYRGGIGVPGTQSVEPETIGKAKFLPMDAPMLYTV